MTKCFPSVSSVSDNTAPESEIDGADMFNLLSACDHRSRTAEGHYILSGADLLKLGRQVEKLGREQLDKAIDNARRLNRIADPDFGAALSQGAAK